MRQTSKTSIMLTCARTLGQSQTRKHKHKVVDSKQENPSALTYWEISKILSLVNAEKNV